MDDLTPYDGNARTHGEADVDAIASSIREFGFSDPIGVWGAKNLIVEGHGRLLAAKKLGMSTVPVIRLDHLSAEQRKAYTLAHNRTAELSAWDFEALTEEINSISSIDMSDFGFEIDLDDPGDDDDFEDDHNERERTFNGVNLLDFDANRAAGFYQMPMIKAVDYIPSGLLGFNYVKSTPDYDKTVHFFIDDYQFERIWNSPREIIERIIPFAASLTPDFSLYMDMPMAMKIWNVYRSRLVGQLMQDAGITVIPTLSWAEPETFSFCFDGLGKHGTYAVSTVGVMRDDHAQAVWEVGMTRAIDVLEPKTIICYGARPDFDFGKINTVFFEARKFG